MLSINSPNSHDRSLRRVFYCFHFTDVVTEGTEKVCNIPKVTQLISEARGSGVVWFGPSEQWFMLPSLFAKHKTRGRSATSGSEE